MTQPKFHRFIAWPMLEGVQPAPVRIQFLPPHVARGVFLGRYRALTFMQRNRT
jgi:hypothetical protein